MVHLIGCHTGHGEGAEVILSPCVTGLIHNPGLLTVSTLEGSTLALLTVEDDGVLRGLREVNFDTIEEVLSHWVVPLFGMNIIYMKKGGGVPPVVSYLSVYLPTNPLAHSSSLIVLRFTLCDSAKSY